MPPENPQTAAALKEGAGHVSTPRNPREAEALIAQALALHPQDADVLHLAANVYVRHGEYAKAEEMVRRALALDGKNGAYYLTCGLILQEQGRLDEAIAMNKTGLCLSPPGLVHCLYTNLGICHYHKRAIAEAIDNYTRALEINPDFAPAWFRRGLAYFTQGDANDLMMADFRRAVALDPGNAAMLQKMASVIEKYDYVQALQILQQAIKLKPDMPDAWVMLANHYNTIGDVETALSIYQDMEKRFPGHPTVRLESAYMFPSIPKSNEDITLWRERVARNLDRLMRENFLVRDPEWRVLNPPFYQAYHGRNNVEIMEKLAAFFLHCCPNLAFTAPHCVSPPRKKDKIRLGFVSELFHTVLLDQCYGALLDALTQDNRFEVVLMATSARTSETVDRLTAAAHRYITLPSYLEPAQQAIAREEIDILIYLDIGMIVMNYLLAFARLAPIQMVMSGHPVTTGIPNMDYFITSRAAEPENAAGHYSEKLFLLEKNTVVLTRKKLPEARKTRAELGLPEEARLYACPVTLFKIHPDMDRVFDAILERDPKALIILFDSSHKSMWRENLQKRFAASMPPERAARIRFLPWANGDHFYHLLWVMDCVLDTLHFSFGVTAFLMVGADVPFVTLPGEFMRGRAGTMLYRKMELPELIAKSPEHYVELALKLAQDKDFHARMANLIRERSSRVFDDYSVIEPFNDALWDLYNAHAA